MKLSKVDGGLRIDGLTGGELALILLGLHNVGTNPNLGCSENTRAEGKKLYESLYEQQDKLVEEYLRGDKHGS